MTFGEKLNIKKSVATLGLAAALAVTGGTVAQVGTADLNSKAEAYTATQCHTVWYNGWQANTVCYYDYNWWEESWMGGSHKDGWYRTGTGYA
jgi:hypothetical protein